MANNTSISIFTFTLDQRRRFQSGELCQEWARCYPDIFDHQDVDIATRRMGYHFYEWLAAVLIHESTGYLSLVEQYEFKKHKRKQEVLQKRVPRELFELITHHSKSYGRIQCPDLFVYSSDGPDWYFCEVKGPKDTFSKRQQEFFKALEKTSGRPVRTLRFRQA